MPQPLARSTPLPPLRLLIAAPRGFCAGVDRAIKIVELAIERFGPPVYVRHEIVHNKHVVESLKADPEAEVSSERAAIDELIFDLFEIRSSRAQILDFYDTVGRAERSGEDVEALEAQAANE